MDDNNEFCGVMIYFYEYQMLCACGFTLMLECSAMYERPYTFSIQSELSCIYLQNSFE